MRERTNRTGRAYAGVGPMSGIGEGEGNPNGPPTGEDRAKKPKKPCPICGKEKQMLPYHIQQEHS